MLTMKINDNIASNYFVIIKKFLTFAIVKNLIAKTFKLPNIIFKTFSLIRNRP